MTISTTQIVDILYKKLSGVSKTDTAAAKSPANEANASPQLSPGSTIWQQDYLIPAVNLLPTVNSAVVTVYRDTLSTTVQAAALSETIANETWATGLTNWIPPQFGSGYQVKLYAGPAGSSNPQTLTNLPVGGSGNSDSWYFDYAAGIVNFADTNVPTAVAGNVVYVVGARYTGITGISRFGNVTVGNISINGNTLTGNAAGITLTGNVTSGAVLTNGLFYPNGQPYNFDSTYSNANVAAYLPYYGGNILASTIAVDTITPNNNPVTVFDAVTAVGIPAGSTADRPTPVAGYMRFNSDTLAIEYYDGAAWVSVTNTILDQQLAPDGTSNTYTLDQTSTQVGIIVSINGTLQHPGTAYTVTGDQITFTETPLVTDLVDIRFLGQAVTIAGNIGGGGGNYSNSDVAAYLPTDSTIRSIKANIGAFETYANLTFGTSTYGNTQVAAYLTANPQGSTYSNTNVAAYIAGTIGAITANTTAANAAIATIQANVGSYYIWANANVAGLSNRITGANATISTIQANVGSFYTWANTTFSTSTYSNANVVAYLVANPQGSTYSNANVVANLANYTTNITSTANITAANLLGNLVLSSAQQITSTPGTNANVVMNPAGTGQFVVTSTTPAWFGNTITSQGNITAPYFVGNTVGTTAAYTGNVQAAYFVGNGSGLTGITANGYGNIYGTTSNVTLVAGTYAYTFDTTGTFTLPANGDIVMPGSSSILSASGTTLLGGYSQVSGYYSTLGVKYAGSGTQHGMTLQPVADNTTAINFLNAAGNSVGNITQTSSTVKFVGDGSGLSNVATKTTGSWTVTTGTGTYSITVPASGTYQIWVRGNIPNGIITYLATVVVTNTNVPVLGAQYAWVYTGGGSPIDFTSIPNQFTGTGNTIVRSSVAPSATTNRFDFGISNTSGSSQTVYWGYVALG
jgi:hypothetical protein